MSGITYKKSEKTRNPKDFYQTPHSITRHLLDNEDFLSCVLDPAEGAGAIIKVLRERGISCIGCDIKQGKNFLYLKKYCTTIITNPPYSLANEFILKAKTVCDKFAFLLPLDYLHGKKRHDKIYSVKDGFPLIRVYVFIRKPLLSDKIREDGKYETGMVTYAWFVWERLKPDYKSTGPVIIWIDNDMDVIGGRKEKRILLDADVLF